MNRTCVYIDGFNLYHRALRDTPYRWLNVAKMCELLLPNNTINTIKYFTAKVQDRPGDPSQSLRQQLYLRALATIPNLTIHYGYFLSHDVDMPLAKNPKKYARVIKTEEKGSDVSLASHLLNDAHKGLFDIAVIVSNDSDFLEPIKIIRQELHKSVGMINPHTKQSTVLAKNTNFTRQIREGVLRASQFPDQVRDNKGVFHKPPSWK